MNSSHLEEKTNAFLDNMNDDNIIDIKYQNNGYDSTLDNNCPSVMIIMKSEEPNPHTENIEVLEEYLERLEKS